MSGCWLVRSLRNASPRMANSTMTTMRAGPPRADSHRRERGGPGWSGTGTGSEGRVRTARTGASSHSRSPRLPVTLHSNGPLPQAGLPRVRPSYVRRSERPRPGSVLRSPWRPGGPVRPARAAGRRLSSDNSSSVPVPEFPETRCTKRDVEAPTGPSRAVRSPAEEMPWSRGKPSRIARRWWIG